MRAKTIAKHIMESNLTKEEIHDLWDALKRKSAMLSAIEMLAFSKGDYVKFRSKKRGQMVFGKVTKLNRKSVTVMASTGVRWNVSPELLKESNEDEYAAAPSGLGLREYGGVR